MSIIAFPSTKKLVAVTAAHVQQFKDPMPLSDLLDMNFPQSADVDADTGELIAPEHAREFLEQIFYAFGLRLPPRADGVLTHQLWGKLHFTWGRIVRLELNGGNPRQLSIPFSEAEFEYGRLVAAGNVAAARRQVRTLLPGSDFIAFFA